MANNRFTFIVLLAFTFFHENLCMMNNLYGIHVGTANIRIRKEADSDAFDENYFEKWLSNACFSDNMQINLDRTNLKPMPLLIEALPPSTITLMNGFKVSVFSTLSDDEATVSFSVDRPAGPTPLDAIPISSTSYIQNTSVSTEFHITESDILFLPGSVVVALAAFFHQNTYTLLQATELPVGNIYGLQRYNNFYYVEILSETKVCLFVAWRNLRYVGKDAAIPLEATAPIPKANVNNAAVIPKQPESLKVPPSSPKKSKPPKETPPSSEDLIVIEEKSTEKSITTDSSTEPFNDFSIINHAPVIVLVVFGISLLSAIALRSKRQKVTPPTRHHDRGRRLPGSRKIARN